MNKWSATAQLRGVFQTLRMTTVCCLFTHFEQNKPLIQIARCATRTNSHTIVPSYLFGCYKIYHLKDEMERDGVATLLLTCHPPREVILLSFPLFFSSLFSPPSPHHTAGTCPPSSFLRAKQIFDPNAVNKL